MDGLIRVSISAMCHDGNGKLLMQRRSKGARDEHERWDGGGGGLKFGERVDEGAVREILEEYGAHAKEVVFMGYRDVHRIQEGRPTHWVSFDFKILVDPKEVVIGEPHKCDEIRWLTVEEIDNFPEPTHSMFPAFWNKNRKHFI